MKKFDAVFICISIFILVSVAFGFTWSQFHGDPQHTGRTVSECDCNSPKIIWSFETSAAIYTSPILDDDAVYFGSYNDTIYCIDRATGEFKWSFGTRNRIRKAGALTRDSVVVFPSEDSTVYGLHKETGALIWSQTTVSSCIGAVTWDPVTDNVYLTSFYDSGWHGWLYAYNSDGTFLWSQDPPGGGTWMLISPAIDEFGHLITADFHNPTANVTAYDSATGTIAWNINPTTPGGENDIHSSPAIDFSRNRIYYGEDSGNRRIMAIDYTATSATVAWTYMTGNAIHSSPALGADGTVYIGSSDNKLYAINPDGSLRWTFATSGAVSSSPLIAADGAIYFGSNDNNLYCLESTGAERWRVTLGGAVVSSPAMDEDGNIYVGCNDGNLYAIRCHYPEPEIDSVWFREETDCDSRNIVEICYMLSDIYSNSTYDVTIVFSTDNGATWWMPFDSIFNDSGDIGADVDTGLHCFEWEVGYDMPGVEGDSFLIEVTAEYNDSLTITVPGASNLFFSGRPPGFALNGDSVDICPPVCIDIGDCIDSMTIVAAGTASYFGGFYPPTGNPTYFGFPDAIYQDSTGISACDGNNICSFTAVFLDTIPPSIPGLPPHFPFDAPEPLMPLPQQSFYIGLGKRVIPPAGAIQLCFGVKDYHGWADNHGAFRAGISRFGLCDRNRAEGILDTEPPEVTISASAETLSCRDTLVFSWIIDDMFPNATSPCSLFIDYCDGIDTIITFEDSLFWPVPPVNCDSGFVAIAAPDSFCNWGYDTIGFVLYCDTISPVAAIVNPPDGAFSACDDEFIAMTITDNETVDTATIRLVVEGDTFDIADPELLFENDTLYFYPDPPFADGQVVDVCLIAANDVFGNLLEGSICWSFTMDLAPPWSELTIPQHGIMTQDVTHVIEIIVGDNGCGIAAESLVLVIYGESFTYSSGAFQWTSPNIHEGTINFDPAENGMSFQRGDTVFIELTACDGPDLCPANYTTNNWWFVIEPDVPCDIFPNPFTPNGDNINDFAAIKYPYLYSESATIYFYNLRGIIVHEMEIAPPEFFEIDKLPMWDGRDSYGKQLEPGIYIYMIKQANRIICNGTVLLVR